MNFSAATEHCRSMDSYLAEPRTEEELDILLNFTRNLGDLIFWVGATYSDNKGIWVWQTDGQVLSYYKYPESSNHRDCLSIFTSVGFVEFVDCHFQIFSICQRKFEGNKKFCYVVLLKVWLSHTIKRIYFN